MKNQILNDGTVVYYAVKLSGKIVTTKFGTQLMAEQALLQLPQELQPIAEVVTITADGKEILLG